MRWELLEQGGGGGGARWGHSLNYVKQARRLFLFGGYGQEERQSHQVHVFDIVERTWSKPAILGTPPCVRDSHTCTTLGAKLFVFGGTDGEEPLSDLHVMNTDTDKWTSPATNGDVPPGREGHGAAVVGDTIYIFGGSGSTGSKDVYFNDLYALNTETFTWTKVRTSGTPPCPRDRHSMSSWGERLVVFGGVNARDEYLADVHVFDTATMNWKELKTSGCSLMPRAGHTADCLGDSLLVFGGFMSGRRLLNDVHQLNIMTGEWCQVLLNTSSPSPRFAMASETVDVDAGVVLVYGGCNDNLEALSDMYYLHTGLVGSAPAMTDVEQEHSAKSSDEDIHPYDVKPVSERIFEGKITNLFHYGYTLEAAIDGKPFRGLLFSYRPGFEQIVEERKKAACRSVEVLEVFSSAEEDQVQSQQYREMLSSSSNPFLNDLVHDMKYG